MTKRLSNNGFSIVEVVVILLIVAVLGFGGFFVWHKHHKAPTKRTASETSQSTAASTKTSDPTDGGKYLVIKEWGVRFALPSDLRGDIQTYISDAKVSGNVLFASRKLNTMLGDDTCNFVKQPDGAYAGGIQPELARLNPKTYPTTSLDYYKSQLTYVKTIGDYEYYYTKETKDPPVTCLTGVTDDPAITNVEEIISTELTAAFQTIQTTN